MNKIWFIGFFISLSQCTFLSNKKPYSPSEHKFSDDEKEDRGIIFQGLPTPNFISEHPLPLIISDLSIFSAIKPPKYEISLGKQTWQLDMLPGKTVEEVYKEQLPTYGVNYTHYITHPTQKSAELDSIRIDYKILNDATSDLTQRIVYKWVGATGTYTIPLKRTKKAKNAQTTIALKRFSIEEHPEEIIISNMFYIDAIERSLSYNVNLTKEGSSEGEYEFAELTHSPRTYSPEAPRLLAEALIHKLHEEMPESCFHNTTHLMTQAGFGVISVASSIFHPNELFPSQPEKTGTTVELPCSLKITANIWFEAIESDRLIRKTPIFNSKYFINFAEKDGYILFEKKEEDEKRE